MYATYTCEQCDKEYSSDAMFVPCGGDACNEEVCKECAKPCKDPTCKRWVCDQCRQGQSAVYCGEYCIKHAMWSHDKDDEWEWKNFDYVAKGMTHEQGKAFLEKHPTGEV